MKIEIKLRTLTFFFFIFKWKFNFSMLQNTLIKHDKYIEDKFTMFLHYSNEQISFQDVCSCKCILYILYSSV